MVAPRRADRAWSPGAGSARARERRRFSSRISTRSRDGENFTEGYRDMKLGKVVGEPTAGWDVYTGAGTMVDGTTVRLPFMRNAQLDERARARVAGGGHSGRSRDGRELHGARRAVGASGDRVAVADLVEAHADRVTTLTIGPAALGDEGRLASLNAIVQDLHVARRPDVFRATERDELEQWFRSMLERSTTQVDRRGGRRGGGLRVMHAPSSCGKPVRGGATMARDRPDRRRPGVPEARYRPIRVDCRGADSARFWCAERRGDIWAFNEPVHELLRTFGFTPKIVRFELPGGVARG